MAFKHTEDSLKALNKDKVIQLVLHLQEKASSLHAIREEIANLKQSFQSEILVVKNVNTLLSKQTIELQKQVWTAEQYSGRECVEFQGIPNTVPNETLEATVCEILDRIDAGLNKENTEACHRIKGVKQYLNYLEEKIV